MKAIAIKELKHATLRASCAKLLLAMAVMLRIATPRDRKDTCSALMIYARCVISENLIRPALQAPSARLILTTTMESACLLTVIPKHLITWSPHAVTTKAFVCMMVMKLIKGSAMPVTIQIQMLFAQLGPHATLNSSALR